MLGARAEITNLVQASRYPLMIGRPTGGEGTNPSSYPGTCPHLLVARWVIAGAQTRDLIDMTVSRMSRQL